ncbi:MAG: thioesterase family protein [Ideonella sp.]|nr:thioesterase family protein [Ideonella sp.]MCC7458541.1 thioesterase family protein [Nitrospira sp.]
MTPPQPPRRSAAEQARLNAALTAVFEQHIRFNQVLGLKVSEFGDTGPTIRFEMRPELVGHTPSGRLHGGVISATLDALGGMALMWAIGEKHAEETAAQVMHRWLRVGTIDLRVDYLRPGIGRYFTADAAVLRLGGRVGSTQMRLHSDGGSLIATATAAYVVS